MYFCAATGEQAWTGEKKRRRTNEEREWKKGRFICTARLAGGLARGSVCITVRYGIDHGVLGNVFFILLLLFYVFLFFSYSYNTQLFQILITAIPMICVTAYRWLRPNQPPRSNHRGRCSDFSDWLNLRYFSDRSRAASVTLLVWVSRSEQLILLVGRWDAVMDGRKNYLTTEYVLC